MGTFSNERKGLHLFLNFSFVYNFLQNILGSKKLRLIFVHDYIRPLDGQTILDFGCGTGKLFELLNGIADVKYFGIEPNPKYVEGSKKRYGKFNNAQFYCGSIEVLESVSEKYDTIVMSAVLHHLQTEIWSKIIEALYVKLKPGGRIVLLDNVFHPNQNFLSKLLIGLDRGQSVVHIDNYIGLISRNYILEYDLRTDLLNVPYSHIITTIR